MATYTVNGKVDGTITLTEVTRAQQAQEALAAYPLLPQDWVIHDAPQTKLPGTSASDDLGVYGTEFATNSMSVRTFDVKTLSTTLYARRMLWLPPEYDPGETFTIRLYAGMVTTVASTSCTIDVQCYKSDNYGGIGADLCTTAAQSINSLTPANKDFTITPPNLVPGDIFDLRIAIAVVDAATATAVIGELGAAFMLIDIRG